MTSTKPIPPPPPDSHTPTLPAPAPALKRSYTGVFIVVLVLIIVLVIILIVRHNRNKNANTDNNTQSVAQIQQIFQPPPVVTSQPSGEVSGAQTGTSTPKATTLPQLYTNQELGFQLEVGADWQVKPFSSNEVVISSQTGDHYSIQVYNNAPDLPTIQTQLQGSPSVKKVSDTIFLNQPALSFTTTSDQPGVAVINSGKLYYIMGDLNSTPLNSFKFLTTSF